MSVIFCYAVYNEERALRQSLESVKPYADRIVVVEGRYAQFAGTNHSTDATVEIALEYVDEVIRSSGLPQHLQRDLYLRGREGDFYFIIDGDEILRGRFPKEQILAGPWDVYAVEVRRRGHRATLCLRLF